MRQAGARWLSTPQLPSQRRATPLGIPSGAWPLQRDRIRKKGWRQWPLGMRLLSLAGVFRATRRAIQARNVTTFPLIALHRTGHWLSANHLTGAESRQLGHRPQGLFR